MEQPSKSILRLVRNLTVPEDGHDAVAWLVDTTGPELTRRTWGSDCPYKYSPSATWVRLAMATDKRRLDKTLRVLANWVPSYRDGEMHDAVKLPNDSAPTAVAKALVATAVWLEPDTPLVIITVFPGGLAEFHSARYPNLMLTTPHIDQLPEGWAS